MAEHSPLPWQLSSGATINHIIAANSQFVCDVCGYSGSTHELDNANAALIVEAVNERDRLRDLIRRLADTLQSIIDVAEGRGTGRLDEGLVREAREALKEDKL